jgi:predicted NAD/FAD-binding protein
MLWFSLILTTVVWGHCNKTLSNKLQKPQNRTARILTFSSYDTNADLLLEKARLETVRRAAPNSGGYHGL